MESVGIPDHAPAGSTAPPNPSGLLIATDVSAGYRDNLIVRGISLEVPKAGIVAIVGPNGSGKSTLIKALFGLVRLQGGTVVFDGRNITRRTPADLLSDGVGYVPQLPSIFPSMSVWENLEMGLTSAHHTGRSVWPAQHALDLFPALADRRHALAGTLSGGERRMLEIGRTMLLQPSLILLDEPSVGLSPSLTKRLFAILLELREATGVAMLVVEQNVRTALDVCDEALVIVSGQVAHRGKGADLLADPVVRRSFLGAGRPTPLTDGAGD
jgi:ABC-type branched-subunit amino acid transport system ATPase component